MDSGFSEIERLYYFQVLKIFLHIFLRTCMVLFILLMFFSYLELILVCSVRYESNLIFLYINLIVQTPFIDISYLFSTIWDAILNFLTWRLVTGVGDAGNLPVLGWNRSSCSLGLNVSRHSVISQDRVGGSSGSKVTDSHCSFRH